MKAVERLLEILCSARQKSAERMEGAKIFIVISLLAINAEISYILTKKVKLRNFK